MYTLLSLKWITNKDLLIAQETLLSVIWQLDGREFGVGEWLHVYVWLSPLLNPSQSITTLLIGCASAEIKKLKKKKKRI